MYMHREETSLAFEDSFLFIPSSSIEKVESSDLLFIGGLPCGKYSSSQAPFLASISQRNELLEWKEKQDD